MKPRGLTPRYFTVGDSGPLWRVIARNDALAGGGLAVLLGVQYLSVFLGFGLPIPALFRGTVFALAVLAQLLLAVVISTVCYRRSGRLLPGAFLVGTLFPRIVVGGGPIHLPI